MRRHFEGAHARFVRPLAPRGRKNYELWDLGLIVAPVAVFWYLTTNASASTADALSETSTSAYAWGWVLVASGLVASALAYLGRTAVYAGYLLLMVACFGWAGWLGFGVLYAHADWQMTGKTLGVIWIFASLGSRAFRDGIAADPDDHTMTDNAKVSDVSDAA